MKCIGFLADEGFQDASARESHLSRKRIQQAIRLCGKGDTRLFFR